MVQRRTTAVGQTSPSPGRSITNRLIVRCPASRSPNEQVDGDQLTEHDRIPSRVAIGVVDIARRRLPRPHDARRHVEIARRPVQGADDSLRRATDCSGPDHAQRPSAAGPEPDGASRTRSPPVEWARQTMHEGQDPI